MATKKRSKRQVKTERHALKILKSSGLYTGKIDLRKAPSSYQRRAMRRFADVISGAAKVVKPKSPKDYKGILPVRGDKVIVPRKKGERVKLDRNGEIVIERKVGKRTTRRRFKRKEKIKKPKKKRNVRYGIPFNVGAGKTHTMWFPDMESLEGFMAGYDRYKNWKEYIIEEEFSGDEMPDDDDDE